MFFVLAAFCLIVLSDLLNQTAIWGQPEKELNWENNHISLIKYFWKLGDEGWTLLL